MIKRMVFEDQEDIGVEENILQNLWLDFVLQGVFRWLSVLWKVKRGKRRKREFSGETNEVFLRKMKEKAGPSKNVDGSDALDGIHLEVVLQEFPLTPASG
jgi:hypothetical protein